MANSRVRSFLLAPAYYAAALALAILIIANANDASRTYESVSAHESVSAKTDRALRDALESLSLGLYGGGTEMAEQLAAAIGTAEFHEARAVGAGWLLLGLSIAFLAAVITMEDRARRARSVVIIRHLFGVSGIFLMIGLLAPILTVVAHEEIALLGRVVLQYESKGIITTIHKLYLVKNFFLAQRVAGQSHRSMVDDRRVRGRRAACFSDRGHGAAHRRHPGAWTLLLRGIRSAFHSSGAVDDRIRGEFAAAVSGWRSMTRNAPEESPRH
jgi:hypothetical protein